MQELGVWNFASGILTSAGSSQGVLGELTSMQVPLYDGHGDRRGRPWDSPAKTLPTLLQGIHLVLPPLFQGRVAGLAQLARHLDQAAPACPGLYLPKIQSRSPQEVSSARSQNPAPGCRFLASFAWEHFSPYEDFLTIFSCYYMDITLVGVGSLWGSQPESPTPESFASFLSGLLAQFISPVLISSQTRLRPPRGVN